MVTGANPATWAGRGIIVSLWELKLVVPFPMLALGPGPLLSLAFGSAPSCFFSFNLLYVFIYFFVFGPHG